ncbi:MAG: histidinol-phosphate aminotransferase family protein [Cellvibrionaceae bacterium]|nr:histidinol-phosphate aminotransferase family protein [Cellvibrionaceae bacterium]
MSIFKAHIAAMSAYKPPLDGRDPHAHLLLDFNERTLPIAEVVQEALIAYIRSGRLQMYPAYGDTVELIAGYCGVPAEQVMITNGSDQGIDLIIRAACREGEEAIIPGPGFPIYAHCAKIENLKIREPQYTREQGFPTEQVLAAITPKTRLICFGNPNNPSGTVVPRADIIRMLEAAPQAAVLVDECYYEYFGESAADLVGRYPNLVITRTFSKTWGMPSLRLGYIISHPDNIRALLNVRGPYDINQMAVVAIRAALAHPEYTHAYVAEVMREAKPMLENFLAEVGVEFWPSGANYVWMFPANAEAVNHALLKHNILVRPKADADGRMGLRITVGTIEQTRLLLSVLRTTL